MAKDDPNDIRYITIPVCVDKRTAQEVDKLIFETNIKDMDDLHPVSYGANPTDPYTPWLHEATHGHYIEGFTYATGNDIYSIQKNKMWSIVTLSLFLKGERVVKPIWSFMIKMFLDVTMRKLKERFRVRGNTKIYGIDSFDTYAPMV